MLTITHITNNGTQTVVPRASLPDCDVYKVYTQTETQINYLASLAVVAVKALGIAGKNIEIEFDSTHSKLPDRNSFGCMARNGDVFSIRLAIKDRVMCRNAVTLCHELKHIGILQDMYNEQHYSYLDAAIVTREYRAWEIEFRCTQFGCGLIDLDFNPVGLAKQIRATYHVEDPVTAGKMLNRLL